MVRDTSKHGQGDSLFLVLRRSWLTVQNASGWKNIVTKVKSFIFLARRVDARLSMTALALNS